MKLKRLEVNDFGKINNASPVVIDFTESNFVVLKGDNKTGKTSMINAMLVALGHLSKDNKNFVNNDTGKLDVNLEFVENRKTYRVRVTKSQFKLEYEGDNLPEPITKMKELLGVPGVSPIAIKTAKLKEQLKYFHQYAGKNADEFDAEDTRLKEAAKGYANSRAEANKQYKALKETLADEPMFASWEQSEAKFGQEKSLKTLSERLDAAGKRSDLLIQAEVKLKSLKKREEELLAELAEVQAGISKGQKYVDANKDAKKEYDQIRAEYDNAAQHQANYNKWKDIKAKQRDMDEFETIVQQMDAKEKECIEARKKLHAEILPDIKGVEIVLEDEYENGKLVRPEGFYRNGANAAQMSMGEWITTVIEILKKNKTKVLILDELEAIGSEGVELLHKLANSGCHILAAEVSRGTKTLEIENL